MRPREQSGQHLLDLRRAGHDKQNEREPPELARRHRRDVGRERGAGPRGFRDIPRGREPSGAVEIARNPAPHVAEADDGRIARHFPLICCGSHSASSGQTITMTSTTNMIRWNGIVPYTTSESLPSQMLWITNRLMPIGGEICPSSM